MRRGWGALFVLTFIPVIGFVHTAFAADPTFELELVTDHTTYTGTQTILIQVRLTNLGDTPLYCDNDPRIGYSVVMGVGGPDGSGGLIATGGCEIDRVKFPTGSIAPNHSVVLLRTEVPANKLSQLGWWRINATVNLLSGGYKIGGYVNTFIKRR